MTNGVHDKDKMRLLANVQVKGCCDSSNDPDQPSGLSEAAIEVLMELTTIDTTLLSDRSTTWLRRQLRHIMVDPAEASTPATHTDLAAHRSGSMSLISQTDSSNTMPAPAHPPAVTSTPAPSPQAVLSTRGWSHSRGPPPGAKDNSIVRILYELEESSNPTLVISPTNVEVLRALFPPTDSMMDTWAAPEAAAERIIALSQLEVEDDTATEQATTGPVLLPEQIQLIAEAMTRATCKPTNFLARCLSKISTHLPPAPPQAERSNKRVLEKETDSLVSKSPDRTKARTEPKTGITRKKPNPKATSSSSGSIGKPSRRQKVKTRLPAGSASAAAAPDDESMESAPSHPEMSNEALHMLILTDLRSTVEDVTESHFGFVGGDPLQYIINATDGVTHERYIRMMFQVLSADLSPTAWRLLLRTWGNIVKNLVEQHSVLTEEMLEAELTLSWELPPGLQEAWLVANQIVRILQEELMMAAKSGSLQRLELLALEAPLEPPFDRHLAPYRTGEMIGMILPKITRLLDEAEKSGSQQLTEYLSNFRLSCLSPQKKAALGMIDEDESSQRTVGNLAASGGGIDDSDNSDGLSLGEDNSTAVGAATEPGKDDVGPSPDVSALSPAVGLSSCGRYIDGIPIEVQRQNLAKMKGLYSRWQAVLEASEIAANGPPADSVAAMVLALRLIAEVKGTGEAAAYAEFAMKHIAGLPDTERGMLIAAMSKALTAGGRASSPSSEEAMQAVIAEELTFDQEVQLDQTDERTIDDIKCLIIREIELTLESSIDRSDFLQSFFSPAQFGTRRKNRQHNGDIQRQVHAHVTFLMAGTWLESFHTSPAYPEVLRLLEMIRDRSAPV